MPETKTRIATIRIDWEASAPVVAWLHRELGGLYRWTYATHTPTGGALRHIDVYCRYAADTREYRTSRDAFPTAFFIAFPSLRSALEMEGGAPFYRVV